MAGTNFENWYQIKTYIFFINTTHTTRPIHKTLKQRSASEHNIMAQRIVRQRMFQNEGLQLAQAAIN